jgi:elongation factor 1-gamma
LYGGSFFESALVDQWVDFAANEIEAPRAIWLYPTLGLLDFNQTAYDEAKKDVTSAMTILDAHLLKNQFLASNQITLADIAVVSALVALYRELFSPEYVAKFPNVTRWFNFCVNQAHFIDVIGKVEFAKIEKTAARGGGGKKDKKQKEPKEDKPAEPKQEKKGKGGKKEKEAEAPAPALSANEALEDAAAAEAAAEAKKRNVLDDLPPSKLVLDDAKRLYFKEKPYFKGFWDEFWGNLWDPQGYCVYYSDYKFQSENTLSFMTGNAIGGFLQRLDKARKYMWGVLNISCVNEDTPPYYISGVWIFRGTDIPFEMKDCSDSEYYTWTRLDLSKESDRKILMDEFQADNLSRGEVIDRRFFK